MPSEHASIDAFSVALAIVMAALSVWAARRSASPVSGGTSKVVNRTRWIAIGFAVYSLVRDGGAAFLLWRKGISPWAFVLVDLLSIVPYLLAASRVAGALLAGDRTSLAWWGPALAFGILAPGAYLAVALRGSDRVASMSVVGYLAVLVAIWVVATVLNRRQAGRFYSRQ
jgi:hypothetical protein